MSYIENLLGSPVIPEVQESLGLAAGNYKIKGFNLYASGDLVILDEGLALVDGLRIVSSANLKLSKSSVLSKYVFLRIYTYTETIDGLQVRNADLSLIAQTSSTPVNNTNLYDSATGAKDVLLAYVNSSGVVNLTTSGALGVYDIPTRLTSVESVNTTQDSSISSIGTRTTNLETRATNIETKNTTQDNSITSLGTRATNLETRATNIESVNTTQNTDITSLKTRATNLETRATNIETKNTTQDNRLAAIEGYKILWQGAYHMNDMQQAILSEFISEQATGIIVVWSKYASGAVNGDWHYFFIPKFHSLIHEDNGIGMVLRYNSTTIATKYLYVGRHALIGAATNTSAPNNNFVLRYVLGV